MNHAPPAPAAPPAGPWGLYLRTPLYVRILVAVALGVGLGLLYDEVPADVQKEAVTPALRATTAVVLRLLTLLATPLIFCAVVHALATARASGRMGAKMTWLLMSNTVVAILIGLFVANVVQPGRHVGTLAGAERKELPTKKAFDPVAVVPESVVQPFLHNDILGVILLALAVGVALRAVRAEAAGAASAQVVEALLDAGFRVTMVLLHGLFHLVPLAVLAVVARLVGTQGFAPFRSLAWFVVAVLLALLLQALFYLGRLALGSWVRPAAFLRGASDALVMAFSTASSAATLPITFACMRDKLGVREESASLGVMVGGTFNHDGTALYEAMAALFIAQMIGAPLDPVAQLVVVVMAVFASVGAAGIPEAGLVTMMAVFRAVDLPIEHIPLLLTVDWFLDRCRTAINVMGDMASTCILDGRHPPPAPAPADPPPV